MAKMTHCRADDDSPFGADNTQSLRIFADNSPEALLITIAIRKTNNPTLHRARFIIITISISSMGNKSSAVEGKTIWVSLMLAFEVIR